jgi:hypothetical protein
MHMTNRTPASRIRPLVGLAVAAVAVAGAAPLRTAPGLSEPIVLFRQGMDGVHTFRIPGVAVTARGTVLVTSEARMLSATDRREIEIHLRRSVDGGRSWEPARRVAHHGERLPRNPHMPASKRGKFLGELDEQTVNNAVLVHRLLRAGPSGYSDLAVLPEGGVVCVYESGLSGVGPRGGGNRPWAHACIAATRFDLDCMTSTPPRTVRSRVGVGDIDHSWTIRARRLPSSLMNNGTVGREPPTRQRLPSTVGGAITNPSAPSTMNRHRC